jgi:tetratricopeptide (TPR) repeat protein
LGVGKVAALLAAVVISLFPAQSPAAVSAAAFDSANKLYEEGKFAEAASAYETLAKSGQSSATLCFNLGNAFFKSGQIGRAIAAYRQAEPTCSLRATKRRARPCRPVAGSAGSGG